MNMEIILIAIIVSASCAICGTFLVLRKMSLMGDAISHSILVGIVLGFFISKSLSSSIPLIGAVIAGMISVIFTEVLQKTKLIKNDTAIGLVFPFLFSLGVILVSVYAGNVHLDTDSVLLGELAFAPFDRVNIFNFSLPKSLVQMSGILLVNLIFVILFFKELKLTTFDPSLAKTLGFTPAIMHYSLMFAVSLTCVGAFDSVGAVLVTALMITPAAAALLLTNSLFFMIIISVLIAAASSVSGFYLAIKIDGSISGSMAAMSGLFFAVVYLFSPKDGFIKRKIEQRNLKKDFAIKMLIVHLSHHQGKENMSLECREEHLCEHISWTQKKAHNTVQSAERLGYIKKEEGLLILSQLGMEEAAKSITNT